MEYAFKPTTRGRALIAACMALEAPLKLTRAAVGSGRVAEDVNLADIHQLLQYEAEGAFGERRHEDNRLYLTVQYCNRSNPEGRTFLLSEFIVYAQDPVTGEEGDLLYATLGDYVQSVPPYSPSFPAAIWNFPLTLVISDEINVVVDAPAGLVTYDDMAAALSCMAVRRLDLTIPAAGWTVDEAGQYPCHLEVPVENVTESVIPDLTVLPESTAAAADCGLAPFAETASGALRVWAERVPEEDLKASLTLLRDASGLCLADGTLLPPATEDRIGGVRVGSGLSVDERGTLSVNQVSEDELRELIGREV